MRKIQTILFPEIIPVSFNFGKTNIKWICLLAISLLLTQLSFTQSSNIQLLSHDNIVNTNYFIDDDIKNPTFIVDNLGNFNKETYHLFSHGKPGELYINGSWLKAREIVAFLSSRFKNKDRVSSSINIYGCAFAKGIKGAQAVAYIENALQVKVSASTNITGKDGDWFLEVGQKSNNHFSAYQYNLQFCPDEDGTASNPFKDLGKARNISAAGVYYFDINGTTFSTYVDANGYIQAAIDFGNGTGDLPQGTSLTNTTRGILSPAVLATLTDANEIRLSHSGGALDATSSASVLLNKLLNNTTLHTGINDNADNSSWTGTGANVLTVTGSNGTSTAGSQLQENIFHTRGDRTGFHWIPSLNFQSITINSGEIPDTESLHLWVRANATIDSDCDGVNDSSDLDDDNDGVLDDEETMCVSITTYEVSGNFGTLEGNTNSVLRVLDAPTPSGYTFGGNGTNPLNPGGRYVVTNGDTSANLHSGSLWSGLNGHTTGLGNDAYLAINGSDAQGIFYQDQFTLESGDTYEFGAWVAYASNLTSSTNPSASEVTVRLIRVSDGVEVVSFDSGAIFSREWRKTSSTFTPLTTETYRFELLNKSQQTGGNDFAIDDVFVINLNCLDVDFDGDGIPNRFDLDSDGDGCTDAIEAGISLDNLESGTVENGDGTNNTATTTDNAVASGTYGANGLANSLESDDTINATTNYTSTYSNYALNAGIDYCQDADNDGVPDVSDIDDDNDGILDLDECGDPGEGDFNNWTDPTGTWNTNTSGTLAGNTSENISAPLELTFSQDMLMGLTSLTFIVEVRGQNRSNSPMTTNFGDLVFSTNGTEYVRWENTTATAASFPVPGNLVTSNGATISPSTFDVTTSGVFETYTITIPWNPANNTADLEFLLVSESDDFFIRNFTFDMDLEDRLCPDTDGDGISNRLDLDSDGDGCADAIEGDADISADNLMASSMAGGNTDSTGFTGTEGPVTDNLGNTVDSNGVPTIASGGQGVGGSQNSAIENGCLLDTDSDGIPDITDIDDDNDGILDIVESPSCFMTENQLTDVSRITAVSTDLVFNTTNSSRSLESSADGSTSTWAQLSTTNQDITDKTIIEWELSPGAAVFYELVSFDPIISNYGASGMFKLQGWDGNMWIDLSNTLSSNATSFRTFPIANELAPTTKVSKVRLRGISGTLFFAQTQEVSFNINQSATAVPNGTCTEDLDGDGDLNHLDLDSDADGCSDVVEIGHENFTNNSITTIPMGVDSNNDGLLDVYDNLSSQNQQAVAYQQYVGDASVSACLDSDSDGVPDVTDLDDDNDGILDEVEDVDCSMSASDAMSGMVNFTYQEIPFIQPHDTSPVNVNNIFDDRDGFGLPLSTYDIEDSGTSAVGTNHTDGGLGDIIVEDFYYQFPQEFLGQDIRVRYETEAGPVESGFWVASNDTDPRNWKDPINNDSSSAFFGQPLLDLGMTLGISGVPLGTDDFNDTRGGYNEYEVTVFANPGGNYIRNYVVDPQVGYNIGRFEYFNPTTNMWVTFDDNSVFSAPPCSGGVDTDGDGIPNRLDLDSDGDGCADAVEGSAGLSEGSLMASSMAGGNTDSTGFTGTEGPVTDNLGNTVDSNGVPTIAAGGQLAGESQNGAISNGCLVDTDGDMIADNVDLDDDNDGILDAIESPECFYTNDEAALITSVTSDIPARTASETIDNIIDGNTNSIASFPSNVASVGDAFFTVTPTAPLAIDALEYNPANWELTRTTSRFKLQGFDGVNWVDLSPDLASGSPSSIQTIPNTLHPNEVYSMYQIILSVGNNYLGGIREVKLIPSNNYQASLNPKPNCTDDFDNDGVYNHQDLDSDGDGCPDTTESSIFPSNNNDLQDALVTNGNGTDASANQESNQVNAQLNPEGDDTNNDGLNDSVDANQDGEPDNQSTYLIYAVDRFQGLCVDTDEDGVPDVIDIDDDNDGVLDTDEGFNCVDFEMGADGTFESLSDVALDGGTGQNQFNGNVTGGGWQNASLSADSWQAMVNTQGESGNSSLYVGLADGMSASPQGGVFAAALKGESFETTVNNLMVGVTYRLSFYQANAGNDGITEVGSESRWSVTFGGDGQFSDFIAYRGEENQIWQKQVLFFTATATSQVLNFLATDAGLPSNHTYMAIDGIQIDYATEDNCALDTDNDGVPDYLDLDSDGDGCPDAVEAGIPLDNLESGTVENGDGTNNTITATDNAVASGTYGANGLANSLESDDTENATINYTSTYTTAALDNAVNDCEEDDMDTDGDMILDTVDIDDDNDGILDVDENCVATSPAIHDGTISFNSDQTTSGTTVTVSTQQTNANVGIIGPYDPPRSFVINGQQRVEYTSTVQINPDATSNETVITYTFSNPILASEVGIMIEDIDRGTPTGMISVSGGNATTNDFSVETVLRNGETSESPSLDFNTATGEISLPSLPSASNRFSSVIRGQGSNTLTELQLTISDLGNSGASGDNVRIYIMPLVDCDNDLDNDGISNSLDLDSDNDGISDIYEAGNSTVIGYDTNGNSSIEVADGFVDDGALPNATANNGLDDRIESLMGTTGTGVTPVDSFDTAGDTTPDYLDLDSDDDGIPDAVEARATADYIAYPATIDDTADSDNDGILDIYDDASGFGSTQTGFITGTRLPNADADDTADTLPDYLDTDSDGDGLTDTEESNIPVITGMSYVNPDANINDPLSNTDGSIAMKNSDFDSAEVDFRSLNIDACDAVTSGNTDTDGDGISDICDLDDDNDGILDTVECVVNLGESNFNNWDNPTGNWTLPSSGAFIRNVVDDVVSPITFTQDGFTGLTQLEFTFSVRGSNRSNSPMTTSFNDLFFTINGVDYVEFENTTATAAAFPIPGNLIITNGAQVSPATFEVNSTGFNEYTVVIPWNATEDEAVIEFRQGPGGADDFLVNDFSFSRETLLHFCTDADNDGLANHLDTDSDDDGCPDAVEAAGNFTSDQLTTLSGGSPTASSSSDNFGTTVSNADGSMGVPTQNANGDAVTLPQGTTTAVLDNADATACNADLSLVKIVDKSIVKVNDKIIYTLTVTNSGPNSTTEVEVTDVLPTGLTYLPSGSGTDIPTGTTYNTTPNVWVIGDMALNDIRVLKLEATVNGAGTFVNNARVSKSTQKDTDSDPTNNN